MALIYLQETKAKAYQSTAAAAAMENAVQQTSKFVNRLVPWSLLISLFQHVLLCATGRSGRVLCMEILLLN